MAMDTSESVAKNSAASTASELANSSSLVTLDWLNVYAQVYRESLTPEFVVAYQTALSDLRPEFLHKAFLRAMRSSTFRPTPAEVRQSYAIEVENAPKPKQLELPELSEAERAEVEKSFAALRKKIAQLTPPKVDEKKRRAELLKQRDEILAKYSPAKGKR
jgi:hypothetical protein